MINGIINTANDMTFAIVAGAYMLGAFLIMVIICAIIESISEAAERRRRNKNRYRVTIVPDRRR